MIILGLDTENTIVRIGAVATALTAVGVVVAWIWGSVIPAAADWGKNDPPPLVGQERLKKDEQDIAQNLKALYLQNQKLNARMDHAELSHNIERRAALSRDMAQLNDDIRHHPTESRLREDLQREQQELDDLKNDYVCLKYGKCPVK